jgi:hypothetical protein
MGRLKMVMALGGVLAMLAGFVPDADAASVRVRCDKRTTHARSRISVDGNNLADGTYTARVTSGANVAVSAPEAAAAGEAEFDFDSKPADIAEGATAIDPGFIVTQVLGEILDSQGAVVISSTATCRVHK